MTKAKFVLGGLVATLVAITTLASADTLTDIKQRKKVLVGVDLTFPPFGTLDLQDHRRVARAGRRRP